MHISPEVFRESDEERSAQPGCHFIALRSRRVLRQRWYISAILFLNGGAS